MDMVFCFGCFSEGELAEPLPPKSSRNDQLVDFQVSRPYQELQAQSITHFQMILARYHSLMVLFLVQGRDPSHDAGFH